MKCATCEKTGVEKPEILCPDCTKANGGNAFLFCAKCRKTWSAIDRESSLPHFRIIPGMTYTTTGCSNCMSCAGEIRIIEEGEALRKVSLTRQIPVKMQRLDALNRLFLTEELTEQASDMRECRVPSKKAYSIVCRTIVALQSEIPVLRAGKWLFVLIPGYAGRHTSMDAVELEES